MRSPALASAVGLHAIRRRSLTRRLWCDDNLPAELIDALWRGDMDRLLYASAPLQVKDRCIVVRHDCAAGALLVKRHTWGGFLRTARSAWREASARRCARLGLYLHNHGLPTPMPRACLEQRLGPWGYRSYIVTDYVPGTTLYRYLRFESPTNDELRHLARQVTRIWQRLVELGISHNDMKPENFIVDNRLGIWLIDFEKVRIGGNTDRQRRRHIGDVKNFLHIRGWHGNADAREIFRNAFLSTPYRQWLGDMVSDASLEVDQKLSVLILCDEGGHMLNTRRPIDSVHDIADEIVLVAPSAEGPPEAFDRIEPCGPQRNAPEWVLVLHHDESVTPFLAKELQQRITDERAEDAFRIPIEPQFFGRSIVPAEGDGAGTIRLFRQNRCSYSLASGVLVISADPQQTGKLTGTIQKYVCSSVAEYVERLNEETTRESTQRLQAGQQPRLFRAMIRAIGRFMNSYVSHGGVRSGWTGLQISLLEAVFVWVEESKLYQISGEFSAEVQTSGHSDSTLSEPQRSSLRWDDTTQTKAA